MTSTPITFVYEEPLTPPLPPERIYSGFNQYVRFLDELRHHAAQPIPVVHSLLRDALPIDGFILLLALNTPSLTLAECDPAQRAEIAARLVPVQVSGTRIFERVLENLSVAAAIDGLSYQEWQGFPRETNMAQGLYGLRQIGPIAGAECGLFHSERYCYLRSFTHFGLPHLLADYLAALERSRGDR